MKNFDSFKIKDKELYLHCNDRVEFAGFAYNTDTSLKSYIENIGFKGKTVIIVKNGFPIAKYSIEEINKLEF